MGLSASFVGPDLQFQAAVVEPAVIGLAPLLATARTFGTVAVAEAFAQRDFDGCGRQRDQREGRSDDAQAAQLHPSFSAAAMMSSSDGSTRNAAPASGV